MRILKSCLSPITFVAFYYLLSFPSSHSWPFPLLLRKWVKSNGDVKSDIVESRNWRMAWGGQQFLCHTFIVLLLSLVISLSFMLICSCHLFAIFFGLFVNISVKSKMMRTQSWLRTSLMWLHDEDVEGRVFFCCDRQWKQLSDVKSEIFFVFFFILNFVDWTRISWVFVSRPKLKWSRHKNKIVAHFRPDWRIKLKLEWTLEAGESREKGEIATKQQEGRQFSRTSQSSP